MLLFFIAYSLLGLLWMSASVLDAPYGIETPNGLIIIK